MSTGKIVRWKDEAKRFWDEAPDHSVTLEAVISYKCDSQTGEAFEELVNTFNSSPFREKIKQVNITDTSYLYRHTIPEFAAYADTTVPTKWFLANKPAIDQIEVEYKLLHWKDGFDDPRMKDWLEKARILFAGDENGKGIIPEFRNTVLSEAQKFVMKGVGGFAGCVNFILEECAYTCLHFQDSVLVYPTALSAPVDWMARYYKTNITHLGYNVSNTAQRHRRHQSHVERNKINDEIVNFITNLATNVNFFVMDKDGRLLYKNESLGKIVSNEDNATTLSPEVWKNSIEVMQSQQTAIVEESDKNHHFLSVKSPLVINGEVEGVIGLSVDITNQKKLEALERKKEVQNLAESVVHDIRTPLSVLSLLANHVSLPEKKHIALKNVITSIETILEELLAKYKGTKDINDDKEQDICVQVAVIETLRLMRYQYADSNVKFDYIPDVNSSKQSIFIKGNYSDFCRMLSNLLNNAVESLDKNASGLVKIGIKENDNNSISVFVQDNGCGMSPEMVDKFMNKCDVQTTKEDGHGLGMKQVMRTVDNMQGNLWVSSTENVGTEFCLTFPRSPIPEWFSDTIRVEKGDTVIVLDDDRLIFDIWKDVFADSNLVVKYFTNGRDAVDFISSVEDKSRLFLIADYELRGQKFNGIDVIKLSRMQAHSLVVTNARISEVKPFTGNKLKIFPKLLGLDKIKVVVDNIASTELDFNKCKASA